MVARRSSVDLLAQAGFSGIRETDVTEDFGCAIRAWLDAAKDHGEELRAHDPIVFAQRERDARMMSAAVEDGLLRRSLLEAVSS